MGKQHKPDVHEKRQDYIHQVRIQHEREGYADAGPETKGGEYHRGPKRWTGKGPAPARHIPWPELFKHHISVVEGHQKMMDMVRKHTVEGSANHRMIMGILERCKTMLGDTKQIAYSFIPPAGARDAVPLGSSSASMYPGYSPADHIYGEAAAEYGAHVRAMEKQGVKVKTPGDVEYTVNQNAAAKQRMTEKWKRQHEGQGAQPDGLSQQASDQAPTTNGNASGVNSEPTKAKATTNGHHAANSTGSNNGPDGKPLFIIDTNPTQVDLPQFDNPHRSKRTKLDHHGKLPSAEPETEDISAEVDAKLKAKKEKKEEKKKKRKRDSGEEEKPKKKKNKGQKNDEEMAEEENTGPAAVADVEMMDVEVNQDAQGVGSNAGDEEGEKKRKRKDKDKKKEGHVKKKRAVEA